MNNILIFYICFLNFFAAESKLASIKYAYYIGISGLSILFILSNSRKIKLNLRRDLFLKFLMYMSFTIIPTLVLYLTTNNKEILSAYIRMWFMIPIIGYLYFFKTVNLIKGFIKYSLLINTLGIISILINPNSFGRIQGIFSHPNFYSFYLLIIIICIFRYMDNNKVNNKIGWIYIAINIFMIVSAGSKTALIILIVILGYRYNLQLKNKSIFIKIPIYIFTFFILIFLIWSMKDSISNLRVFNLNYGLESYQVNSFEWRILKWKNTFEHWDSSILGMLFGYGYKSELLYGFKGFVMHNEYLRVIFNSGIIGTILMINFIFTLVKQILNIDAIYIRNFYVSILITLIIGAFSENIFLASETALAYLSIIFSINFRKDDDMLRNKKI
ncbi:MAG: O-antigen ligase family protein [Clostridium sp.]|nr:O-antigen ligase family protein [Clostridium sp.]